MESQNKKLLQQSLLRHYNNDREQVKRFAIECKDFGFDLGHPKVYNIIKEKPEFFTTLITYSDLGILSKINELKVELCSQIS